MQENTQNQDIPPTWKTPFFTVWTGQAFSLLGSQLVQFALIWWLTQETGSATVLATATLVGHLPQLFLGPIAGTLVDRLSRKAVMIIADAGIAAATLVLVLLFYTGSVEIWHIYTLMFIRSLGGAFHWPAMQASTSLMVPREQLSRIQGMNQTLQGVMSIGSAPLGALLMAALPMQGVLAVDLITASIAILTLALITIPRPRRKAAEAGAVQTSVWQDFKAGLRYVRGWPGLLLLMCLASVINLLLTPASSLMPLMVKDHFGGDAFDLAWLESFFGVGVVAGGLLLSIWGGFQRQILTSFSGLIVLGIGMTGMGLIPSNGFTLAVTMMFLVGFAIPMANGPLSAVTQAVVAPEMQGRVFTLMSSLAMAISPLGLIIAGPLADLAGVQIWFLIGGLTTLAIGTGSFFVPMLVRMEENRAPAD